VVPILPRCQLLCALFFFLKFVDVTGMPEKNLVVSTRFISLSHRMVWVRGQLQQLFLFAGGPHNSLICYLYFGV
jgi:hypothetical protein